MSPKKNASSRRCQYIRADGKRCASPLAPNHKTLCLYHWRRELKLDPSQAPEAEEIVSQVLGSIEDLKTATSVNGFLTKLAALRARKLISARDTALFAYIAQLLLFSLSDVKSEFLRLYDFRDWDQLLKKSFGNAKYRLRRSKAVPPPPLPETGREFALQVLARLASDTQDSDADDAEADDSEAEPSEARNSEG